MSKFLERLGAGLFGFCLSKILAAPRASYRILTLSVRKTTTDPLPPVKASDIRR
jgi:hypothetical protein